MTSPPFAVLRQKTYGNLGRAEYVDWVDSSDDNGAAFIIAARNGSCEPLMVLPAQKMIF